MGDSTRASKRHANETQEQREKRLAYHREWMRQFRLKHPEKQREVNRRYRENNREKCKQRYIDRYARDREKIIASVCEYARRNRAKINARNRKTRQLNPQKYKEMNRRRYLAYRERDKELRAARRKELAEYMRNKRNSDPAFLIADRLRRRINSALKSCGAQKSAGLYEVSGCTGGELMAHIEKQFLPGMTWENRRKWHIDHIIPCAAFDLTDQEQQAIAFHYTNLRPVWAEDNQRKQDKIPGGQGKFFWTEADIRDARKRLARARVRTG